MTIVDDDKATVENIETDRLALIAELTWAKLYTKTMHKDLGTISTAIRKSRSTIAAASELKESAEKLHDQLQTANRTLAEISSRAGPWSVPATK